MCMFFSFRDPNFDPLVKSTDHALYPVPELVIS
jgi:hypothetical protein